MKKELRPIHDDVSCDICERTILKGERTEPYLAPGGQRHIVCELCTDRAYNEGWIRESAHMDMPASTRRPQERRSLFGRMRKRRDAGDSAPPPREEPPVFEDDFDSNGGDPTAEPAFEAEAAGEPAPPPPAPAPAPQPPPSRRRDARHVRAVPTNAQVKVERALELFNNSEHVRTIGGIARTLGEPWVSAVPREDIPAEVQLVVAWELSWYRFQIDLGAERDPVTLVDKGHELDELDEGLRDWNASAVADGRIGVGVRSEG